MELNLLGNINKQSQKNLWKYLLLIILNLVIIHPSLSIEKLPVEAFASLPSLRSVKLSPDGLHMACYMYVDQGDKSGFLVYIINLESGKKYYPLMLTQDKYIIRRLSWANNDKLLVSIQFPEIRSYVPTNERRLLVLDFKDGSSNNVFNKAYLRGLIWTPQIQDKVIDLLPDEKDHILMALDRDHKNEYSVLKVNINTGRVTTVMRPTADVVSWMTDQQHRVRASLHLDKTKLKVKLHNLEQDDWQVLWEFEVFSKDAVRPIGFDLDPNILFVQANHLDKKAIFKVNLLDPTYKKQLVYANENYDVNGRILYSQLTKKAIGISDNNSENYVFWDKEYANLEKKLAKALPNASNIIYSFSQNERRYITLATSDQESGTYYLGDRDNNALMPIAQRYEKLTPDILSKTKTVHYQARDGLKIEAFLTLPKDLPEQSLPTVIFPHGGPISHDNNGFDYWTQFFVNRGYAVLKMNFRGSSGYGHNFTWL